MPTLDVMPWLNFEIDFDIPCAPTRSVISWVRFGHMTVDSVHHMVTYKPEFNSKIEIFGEF